MEADNVTVLGDDDTYNSTTNGVTDRPIVADPEYTEVNQAYLQLKAGSFTGLAGRQRITLDNQRFIGNVGWRQNEQTHDALTLKSSALAKTQLHYSYIANANRITGPDEGSQPANYHGGTHALNGKVELGAFGALTGFAYLLEGGATFGQFGLKAGFEVLGGDDQPNHAFQTPLATLHAFQGWADKFLTTPRGGVEDLYLGATATVGPVALQLVWHDFQAEAFSQDYGLADYQADGFATDTTKLWLQFSAGF